MPYVVYTYPNAHMHTSQRVLNDHLKEQREGNIKQTKNKQTNGEWN